MLLGPKTLLTLCALCLAAGTLFWGGWPHAREQRREDKAVLLHESMSNFRRVLKSVELDLPVGAWLSAPARQQLLDKVAVALIGGAGRAAQVNASAHTWLRRFPRKVFVTDVEPDHESVPDILRAVTVNRFRGLGNSNDDIARAFFPADNLFWTHFRATEGGTVVRTAKQPSRNWDLAWYLAQAKYLYGLDQAMRRYPDSDWYLLADSDMFVFADRFAQGVLAGRDPSTRQALGSFWEYPPKARRYDYFNRTAAEKLAEAQLDDAPVSPLVNGLLLGGAGVLISRAAAQRLDMRRCLLREAAETLIPSDWRVTLCLKNAGIPLLNVVGMQQINLVGGCGPGGSQHCRRNMFFNVYPAITKCPHTVHYTRPAEMVALDAAEGHTDQLCIVVANDVTTCECASRAAK